MKPITAIILAAGRGTRMRSDVPKVMHEILGKPIIEHILDSVRLAGAKDIITVIGYGSELVKASVAGTKFITQKRLLGSGDALKEARKALGKNPGDILVVCGDTPLVRPETIKKLIEKHRVSKAAATLLTAELKDPTGYGRIVRGEAGKILKIVEETEADIYEEIISEVNVGTYCFKAGDIFDALSEVRADNDKKEYFLTDAIGILHKKGSVIESVSVSETDEMAGVNTRMDLAKATRILKDRVLSDLMSAGVTMEDTLTTTVYPGAKIGRDTIIKPNTIIESEVEIGRRCVIGPFARLRGGVSLADDVEVGNFVELVRTKVGEKTKIKHHTYLGDAVVGKRVNIGAGTITANYDGKIKSTTVIADGVFIGVGTVLIAPLTIGKDASTGAGSVVPKNHNVPNGVTVVGVPARIFKRRRSSDRRKGERR